jgi:hypothetical protein
MTGTLSVATTTPRSETARNLDVDCEGSDAKAHQLGGGAGVRPCLRMTSATFVMSGGLPGVAASTS